MSIWFSSDWHFNHKNITGPSVSNWKSGYRNFDNIPQMNDTIIGNINRWVDTNDKLYFLGDFAFGDHRKIPELIARINCQNIYLIFGNHDRQIRRHKEYQNCFEWCRDYYELGMNRNLIILSHYAPYIWNESHHGSIALWGHSHGTLPDRGLRWMDVGIDTAHFGEKYVPYHIDDIVEYLNQRPATQLDHHTISTN